VKLVLALAWIRRRNDWLIGVHLDEQCNFAGKDPSCYHFPSETDKSAHAITSLHDVVPADSKIGIVLTVNFHLEILRHSLH
jgi:hypothetical protein